MANNNNSIPIPGRLHDVSTDGIVSGADEIFDDAKGKRQSVINQETDASLDNKYDKDETYSKQELNNLITTPNQDYVTVPTYASLPATGEADTVYRVSNYDGEHSQVDATKYSEYAWDGTQYVFLCVKTQIGEVFDITAYNSNTKYADLTAALGTGGANIPEGLRKGGMSVKFVQSSDNKYVQFRCTSDEFTTDVTQWSFCGDDVIVDNPEYIDVKTDSEDRILEGIKTDGTKLITGNLQVEGSIINEGIQEQLDDALEDIQEEVESIVEPLQDTLSYFETKDNPEWLNTTIDSEDKILEGIDKEGRHYHGTPQVVDNDLEVSGSVIVRDTQNTPFDVAIKIKELEDTDGANKEAFTQRADSIIKLDNPFLYGQRNFAHLFRDKDDSETIANNKIIPSQSIFDVQVSARLGFKFIEANVKATTTDGKFVVIHGEGGKIGWELYDPLGSDITNMVIEETSFDTLRTYRYRSKYEKYRVPVSSLEEFCLECKRCGISVVLEYREGAIEIARSILGNNIIVYGGAGAGVWDGMKMTWGAAAATKASIINHIQHIPLPYLYGLHVNNSIWSNDSDMKDLVDAMHERGVLLGMAGCYQTEVQNQNRWKFGVDYSGSGWEVNEFSSGNICNLFADTDFSDFITNGTLGSDKVLSLAAGETITITNPAQSALFLSKAIMHIRYSGTLHITMGDYIDDDFTEDGTSVASYSTYFMEAIPTFTISAVSATSIYSIDFKASEC